MMEMDILILNIQDILVLTVTTVTNTTVSGTTTQNTLTIQCDSVGVQTCQCKITSATASNSPIWTDVVNFVATSTAEKIILI